MGNDRPQWLIDLYTKVATELLETGFLLVDENGEARLTEKGKRRVAKLLDKLTPGEEVMLMVGIFEDSDVPVSLF